MRKVPVARLICVTSTLSDSSTFLRIRNQSGVSHSGMKLACFSSLS
jgi:hypothetical protein